VNLYNDSYGLNSYSERGIDKFLKERELINDVEFAMKAAAADTGHLTVDAGLKQEMITWKLEGQDDEMIVSEADS
jgi:hypothetical protein